MIKAKSRNQTGVRVRSAGAAVARDPLWNGLGRRSGRGFGLGMGKQAFALHLLARQLLGATDGFRLLANLAFRRLFIGRVGLDLPEQAFALHLLLQEAQGLVDIVVL